MLHYINIHTHKSQNKAYTEVINLLPENAEKIISENPHSLFSVGLHPWYIDDNAEELLKEIEKLSVYNNVVFIGETGLDKVHNIDFSTQIDVFKTQIKIAEKVQKPLIIHCVKAFSEILAIKKELSIKVPLLFHGFRGKPALTEQLLQHNCYLSVGEHAVQLPETIKIIPLNRLFIETDESNMPIAEIYKAVAEIKNVSEQELLEQTRLNFDCVMRK